MARFAVGLSLVLLLSSIAFCQTDLAAGILPFSTQVGGYPDSIDLATSQITISIPIRRKFGKTSFTHQLITNSHVYFSPNANFGLWAVNFGFSQTLAGTLGTKLQWLQTTGTNCNHGIYYYGFAVVDSSGAAHPLPSSVIVYSTDSCNSLPITTTTTDGSGYTVIINSGTNINGGGWTVYDRSGNRVTVNRITGVATATDPDGIVMKAVQTVNSGVYTTVYTDTLNTTALTATTELINGPNGASPDYYTYQDSSGQNQTVTITKTQYTVQTNFGCTSPQVMDTSYGTNYLPTTVTLPTGAAYQIFYEQTPGYGTSYTTGRITKLGLPSGGSITYSYSGGNHGISCLSGVVPTLTRTVNDNNGNSSSTWTYVNSNASPYPGNFTVTETTPKRPGQTSGDTITHYFSGEYETQRIVTDASLGVLSTAITCYGSNGSAPPARTNCPSPSSVPTLPITETDVYTSLGTSSYNEVQTKMDAVYGNVGYKAAYDFGPSLTSQVYNYYGSWNGSACASIGNYINDKLCATEPEDATGTVVAETRYTYNSTGHPTTTSSWVNGSTWLTTTAVFNATGTLSSTQDPAGNRTSYTYTDTGGCNGLLPTGVHYPTVNSLSMATYQTWDCNGAVVTSSTDVNGNTTAYGYSDPLYRLTSVVDPLYPSGTAATTTYQTGSATPWEITSSSPIDSSQTATTNSYLDGLGRVYKTTNALGYETDTVYDALGRKYSVSNPYASTSDPTYGITTYSYDALGRPTLVTLADGDTITTNYSNQSVGSYTEGNASVAFHRYDGLGRLITVCEKTSHSQANGHAPLSTGCNPEYSSYPAFKTSYTWDALNRLIGVNESGQLRSFSYDALSRPTSTTIPEWNTNGHAGSTTYTYTSAGDLYQIVSPEPNHADTATTTATYSFDALHRLTGITYSDPYTVPKRYFWDVTTYLPGFQKGRLVRADTGPCGNPPDCSGEEFSYDADGNVLQKVSWAHVSAGSVTSNFTYNLAREPTTWQDIAGNTYTTSYDSVGRPWKLSSNISDQSHPNPLYTVNTFNALGEQVTATFGNQISRTNVFDKRGRLTSRTDVNGGTTIFSESIGYANTGLISSLTDSANGTWAYTYDDFLRLQTADCSANCENRTNNENYTFAYDEWGNRWSQTFAGSGSGWTRSNAFDGNNHITPSQCIGNTNYFCYDNAGNMKYNGVGASVAIDTEGKIYNYGDATNTVNSIWTATGKRIERTVNGTVYDYVDGNQTTGGLASGNVTSTDLWLGSVHVNTYASGSTYFNHEDHLGDTRIQTDPNKSTNSSYFKTLPFGDWFWNGTQGLNLFADGLVDTPDGGTFNTPNREYNEYTGQWMQPDPAGLDSVNLNNPQTWNRYAYVLNNPLSAVDPLGLDCIYVEDNSVSVRNGDCASSTDDGYYVPGTVVPGSASVSNNGNQLFYTLQGNSYDSTMCIGNCGDMPTFYSQNQPLLPSFTVSSGSDPLAVNNIANTETHWYKNPCIRKAIAKGAATTSLDAIGLLPEGGAVAAGFSLFHGAAGVSNGTKILGRVAVGAALISTASSLSDASGPRDASSTQVAYLQTGVNVFGLTKSLFEAIPVTGQVIAGVAVGLDIVGTGLEIAECR